MPIQLLHYEWQKKCSKKKNASGTDLERFGIKTLLLLSQLLDMNWQKECSTIRSLGYMKVLRGPHWIEPLFPLRGVTFKPKSCACWTQMAILNLQGVFSSSSIEEVYQRGFCFVVCVGEFTWTATTVPLVLGWSHSGKRSGLITVLFVRVTLFFFPRSLCESRKLPIGEGEGSNVRGERRCLY